MEVATFLLDQGAPVNQPTSAISSCRTPLYLACEKGGWVGIEAGKGEVVGEEEKEERGTKGQMPWLGRKEGSGLSPWRGDCGIDPPAYCPCTSLTTTPPPLAPVSWP